MNQQVKDIRSFLWNSKRSRWSFGPKFDQPHPYDRFCSVALNSTAVMFIAGLLKGEDMGTNRVTVFNLKYKTWLEFPSVQYGGLLQDHQKCSATVLFDKNHQRSVMLFITTCKSLKLVSSNENQLKLLTSDSLNAAIYADFRHNLLTYDLESTKGNEKWKLLGDYKRGQEFLAFIFVIKGAPYLMRSNFEHTFDIPKLEVYSIRDGNLNPLYSNSLINKSNALDVVSILS